MADNTSTMSLETNRSKRIEALKEQYLQRDLPPIPSRVQEKTGVLMSQILEENIALRKQVDQKVGALFSVDSEEGLDERIKQLIHNLVEKMTNVKTEQHREKALVTAVEIAAEEEEEDEEEKKVLAAGIYDLQKFTDGASAVHTYRKPNFTDYQTVIDEMLLSFEKRSRKEMKEKLQLIEQVLQLETHSAAREKLVQKLQDKLTEQGQIMADLKSELSEKSELVEVLVQHVKIYMDDSERRADDVYG